MHFPRFSPSLRPTLLGLGLLAALAWLGYAHWSWTVPAVPPAVSPRVTLRPDEHGRVRQVRLELPLAARRALGRSAPEAPAEGSAGSVPWSEPPLVLTPSVPGKWSWEPPGVVVFEPEQALSPATRYLAEFRIPGAEGGGAPGKVGSLAPFVFATGRPVLREVTLLEEGPAHVNLRWEFSQTVSAEELFDHTEVREEETGESCEVLQLSRRPARNHEGVVCVRETATSLRVVLHGGWRGEEGPLPCEETVERLVSLPRELSVLGVSSDDYGFERHPMVTVRLSRKVAPGTRPQLRLTPVVADLRVLPSSGNTFELVGGLRRGQVYQATLEQDLAALQGGVLPAGSTFEFVVPAGPERVRFPMRFGVVAARGNRVVRLQAVGGSPIVVEANRFYANTWPEVLDHADQRLAIGHSLGSLEIAPSGDPGLVSEVEVPLDSLIADEAVGLYQLEASLEDSYTSDKILLAVTDLGLSTQFGREGVAVRVVSLETGRPVEGATITLLSRKRQDGGTAVTDANGAAALRRPAFADPTDRLRFVFAQLGEDRALLDLADYSPWPLERPVENSPEPVGYDAFLFAERGVWRPGETVHLAGWLRLADGSVPPATPLEIELRRPDGRRHAVLTTRAEPEQRGYFHAAFPHPANGPTGPWKAILSTPGAEEVEAEITLPITDFLKQRFELTLRPEAGLACLADPEAVADPDSGPTPWPCVVQARYLWGQPAGGLALRLAGSLRPSRYASARFPGFQFGLEQDERRKALAPVPGVCDAAGQGRLIVALPPVSGYWTMFLQLSGTEPGGSTAQAHWEGPWPAFQALPGLRLPAGPTLPEQTPWEVELVAVNPLDEPTAWTEGQLELVRLETDWNLFFEDDRFQWREETHRLPVDIRPAPPAPPPGSPATIGFAGLPAGSYRLRAVDPNGSPLTELAFTVGDPSSVSPPPHRLELSLRAPPPRPGGTAAVRLETARAGRLWLTLGNTDAQWQEDREVPAGATELDIPIPAAARGSIWLTAFLSRPVDPRAHRWESPVARGFLEIPLDHRPEQFELELRAAPTGAPGSSLPVSVRWHEPSPTPARDPAAAPAEAVVQIWAVDDGLLLPSGYTLPDPHRHFHRRRLWQIEGFTTFDQLLPEFLSAREDTGADALLRILRPPSDRSAQQPPAVVWLEPLRLRAGEEWRGELPVPVGGAGRWRVLAVASTGPGWGRAQATTEFRPPLPLEWEPPPHLWTGDRVRLPVRCFAPDPAAPLQGRLTIEGPVACAEPAWTAPVPQSGPVETWLELTALAAGEVRLQIEVAQGDLRWREERSMRVSAPGSLQTVSRWHRLRAGQEITLEPSGVWQEGAVRQSVDLAAWPLIDCRPALLEVLDYPFGCGEQTTSRINASLAAGLLLDPAYRDRPGLRPADGWRRLALQQNPDGGISPWPGGQSSDPWTSAYVAETARIAAALGQPAPEDCENALADYLGLLLQRGRVPLTLQAHLSWYFASRGEANRHRLPFVHEQRADLEAEGLAWLARGWAAVGRPDLAREALSAGGVPELADWGGRVHSPVRARACRLEAWLDLDPAFPETAALAEELAAALRDPEGGPGTLEAATALRALARWHGPAAGSPARFSAGLRDWPETVRAAPSGEPWGAQVSTHHPLHLFSAGEGDLYLVHTVRGLSPEIPTGPVARGLSIRRTWRVGEQTVLGDPSTPPYPDPSQPPRLLLHSGDLVEVTLLLEAPEDCQVVVLDPLAGGLEVENPWASPASVFTPSPSVHFEAGFDRVLLAVESEGNPAGWQYHLRARTPGTYRLPPVQALDMYRRDRLASQPGLILTVLP